MMLWFRSRPIKRNCRMQAPRLECTRAARGSFQRSVRNILGPSTPPKRQHSPTTTPSRRSENLQPVPRYLLWVRVWKRKVIVSTSVKSLGSLVWSSLFALLSQEGILQDEDACLFLPAHVPFCLNSCLPGHAWSEWEVMYFWTVTCY